MAEKEKTSHETLLAEEFDRLVRCLRKMGAERIILFGSYARGIADSLTDLDLLVIMENDLPFIERTGELYRRLQPRVALDLLAYTPSEWLQVREEPFIRHALRKGGSSMRRTAAEEGGRWLEQAREDLKWASRLSEEGGYHIACFLAQQVAEKALKAFLYARGEELVLGHSVAALVEKAAAYDGGLRVKGRSWAVLDGYYVPTRYPNGLPDSIPARV